MVELVDTQDLKSCSQQCEYRFNSDPGHMKAGHLIGLYLCGTVSFFVYILFSEKLNRFYVGTTDSVERRFIEHNTAVYKDGWSIRGIPWTLFSKIECNSSEEAYKLERFIKKMKSASFIRRLKEEEELSKQILIKIRSGGIGIPKPRERRT